MDDIGHELICAEIIINDAPLIETIYAYELPYAKKYNHESIAGGYIYNEADYLYELLTSKQNSSEYKIEVPILLCQCGCEGCWDFMVTIEKNETNIVWKNFRNPRRSVPDSPGGFWDYRNFSSFCFDKKQYQDAIDKLKIIKANCETTG